MLPRFFKRLFLTAVFAVGCSQPAPMNVVPYVEIERYLGTWHQVAAIPAWFQEDCVSDTTARYAYAADGLIEVVNRCRTADGSFKDAEARARFVGEGRQGKLEVTFVEVLGYWLWLAGGDYWIVGLDSGYGWVVVGSPSRDFAWILARKSRLDDATLRVAEGALSREGFDSCRLLLTMPNRSGSLCEAIRTIE